MTAREIAQQDTSVMSTNTYWTCCYAFIATDFANGIIRDIDFEALCFDIAVYGGIVFG